jgi:sugar (pentulose or hexulose) kinase
LPPRRAAASGHSAHSLRRPPTAGEVVVGARGDRQPWAPASEHVVFGCFLGLANQFRKVLELFRTEATTIEVVGPVSENRLWLHLKADVLDADLSVSAFPEVVSRGAQALASAQSSDWAVLRPPVVAADHARHALLQEWREGIQPIVQSLGKLSW